MIRNRSLTALFVSLCVAGVTSAIRADDAAFKKAIQAQYDKGDQAMLAEKAEDYAEICTPDAVFVAPHKAPETLKELKSHIGPNPDLDNIVVSDRHTIQKLTLDKTGTMAYVDAEENMAGTMVDHGEKFRPNGKKRKWSIVGHRHDLWIKQKKVWLLKKSVLKVGSVFRLDGKAMPIGEETP